MKWIKSLLSAGSEASTIRVVVILCVSAGIGIGCWGAVYVILHRMDPSYIAQIAVLVGVYIGSIVAKAIQSFSEAKNKPEIKDESKL